MEAFHPGILDNPGSVWNRDETGVKFGKLKRAFVAAGKETAVIVVLNPRMESAKIILPLLLAQQEGT